MYSDEEEDTKAQTEESGGDDTKSLDDIAFEKKEVSQEKETENATEEEFMDALYGVPIKVTAILGSTRMSIDHLLKLGRGAVVQLNKQVGAPVDICVNDRLIARGEVVLLEGSLGVTITELIKEVPF